jgi:hypothetical protein
MNLQPVTPSRIEVPVKKCDRCGCLFTAGLEGDDLQLCETCIRAGFLKLGMTLSILRAVDRHNGNEPRGYDAVLAVIKDGWKQERRRGEPR